MEKEKFYEEYFVCGTTKSRTGNRSAFAYRVLLDLFTCEAEGELCSGCSSVEGARSELCLELASGCLQIGGEPDGHFVCEAVDDLGSLAVEFDEVARLKLTLEHNRHISDLDGGILEKLVSVFICDNGGHSDTCHIAFSFNINASGSVVVEA